MTDVVVTISVSDGEVKAIKVTGADAKVGVFYDKGMEVWQTLDSQTSYQPSKTLSNDKK